MLKQIQIQTIYLKNGMMYAELKNILNDDTNDQHESDL